MPKTPSYRKRKDYSQAIVTLTDAVTKRRRDYWLGEYGTTESRERYHRLIAEWEANGRRLPPPTRDEPNAEAATGATIVEVIHSFWQQTKAQVDEGEARSIATALRLLRQHFGSTPAAQFGPKKLRMLRDEMVRGDPAVKPPRRPWSRKYVNAQVQRIRRFFRWAAAHELIPVSVHQSLSTLEPLRRGRTTAPENPKIGPASEHIIDAIRPYLNRPVRALVDLQLLTGARAGELLGLRPCDVEMGDPTGVWTYRPQNHKNAHRERERVIYFGPRAQEILRPFLRERATTTYLFSPAEADANRRAARHAARTTPLSCGNRPGTNRRARPTKLPGDRYTTESYYRAIQYASEKAFPAPPPLGRREGESKEEWRRRLRETGLLPELNAWRRAHSFHPHQLRHNAATLLRREFGLEAAQLALGHASAQITDAVYAERDRAKVIEIMRRIG